MKKDEKLVEEKENFFKKMKEDKKYNAKVQLIGYGVFILIIVVFLNVGSMVGGNSTGVLENDIIEEVNIIDEIDNNYEYNINISLSKGEELVNNYRYYGKRYNGNKEINKEVGEVVSSYYKVNNYYYVMNGEELSFVDLNVIYDLVDSKYVELDDVMGMIDKASLDHVVDDSLGNNESVYNLYVKDMVISVKNDDVISFNVEEVDDKLLIDVDYTNLIKVFDESVTSFKVSYEYFNVGDVEEFSVIKDETLNVE
jgi:hypothetical protein